jgi:hypothetical protein
MHVAYERITNYNYNVELTNMGKCLDTFRYKWQIKIIDTQMKAGTGCGVQFKVVKKLVEPTVVFAVYVWA